MNKIFIVYDYMGAPYFYLENEVINEKWLFEHGLVNYDVVLSILDIDHYKLLYEECKSNFWLN